jgi:hypothetical protein
MNKNTKISTVATISACLFLTIALSSCKNGGELPKASKQTKVITVKNISPSKKLVESGTFKGVGSATVKMPLILPGQKVSFSFSAGKGQTLNFATMYGWSKDSFFASPDKGIALYKADGKPVTGDVSGQVMLYDDGTKTNGTISPNGPATGGGKDTNAPITKIGGRKDTQGNSYVSASKLLHLTLSYDAKTSKFTATIKNISGNTPNTTPFSPGVWVISNYVGGKLTDPMPFFTTGQKDRGNGLSKIAQMGDNSMLAKNDSMNTAIVIPLSPVLVAVYHGGSNPLFEVNEKDFGKGLVDIAQRGDASVLDSTLKTKKGVRNVYVFGKKPFLSGQMVSGQIKFAKGDKIYIATMFGTSNDWFFANKDGISVNAMGDISSMIGLYDDGTALEQYPAAGNRQAGFTGMQIKENDPIMPVGNKFPIPLVKNIIKVILK